ncbi:MAG TPA: tRNA uridine-5-carboxymethylaminomethyl(34) synthesis enzyme MnmG [Spirochaetaceae bacterium]|nr:tRNA uridine-5-carboxymethylaminomethyl(34) synthesis enzyme MnmG [Spirochaetaceae bacterium]
MDCDCLVVGAGHAGLEAAMAASCLCDKVIVITQNVLAIARMSCNPAIGGLAKGNIVKEIDALGGVMGMLADSALLQFRQLNKSRGAAVQAPRAQEDKYLYSENARKLLLSRSNITLIEGTVVDIIDRDGRVVKVRYKENRRDGETAHATDKVCAVSVRSVVLTTGTFMNARTFTGDVVRREGRIGEEAAVGLSENLMRRGFAIARLKTGTPARIIKESIDYSKCDLQKPDDMIIPFSFLMPMTRDSKAISDQLPCHITFTNEKTHKIIRDNFHRSPLFSGAIIGKGPRYCPSIEDKVKRFPDRERHQVFIEPEGRNAATMYLNGLSSSLPMDVQDAFLRTVPGLENCEIQRYAYAVEYDFCDPRDLRPSLESKIIGNLFIAGQTNGTSGYEEAAGQGLIAGINACLKLAGREPLVLRRDEAYIGVLIDDLVTKGTDEPYRMFTSRAEYRISLRADNADRRLTPYAIEIGTADEKRRLAFAEKLSQVSDVLNEIKMQRKAGKNLIMDAIRKEASDTESIITQFPCFSKYDYNSVDSVVQDIKYEGYANREKRGMNIIRKAEGIRIRDDFDYDKCKGLSAETLEKLKRIRPQTLRQATQISGIRQSDLALLSLYVSGKLKMQP